MSLISCPVVFHGNFSQRNREFRQDFSALAHGEQPTALHMGIELNIVGRPEEIEKNE